MWRSLAPSFTFLSHQYKSSFPVSPAFPFGLVWPRRGRSLLFIHLSPLSLLSAEYPWQVAILKKEEFDNVYLCGGSLIDGSHIVTAAHCVDDFKPHELR